jgi:hypothetical protein
LGLWAAGTKKAQQLLSSAGALRSLATRPTAAAEEAGLALDDVDRLCVCFAGLYPLDGSPAADAARAAALADPHAYVLKPQREGGGNNYYNDDVARMLTILPQDEQRGPPTPAPPTSEHMHAHTHAHTHKYIHTHTHRYIYIRTHKHTNKRAKLAS